jgi:hypothetical protein
MTSSSYHGLISTITSISYSRIKIPISYQTQGRTKFSWDIFMIRNILSITLTFTKISQSLEVSHIHKFLFFWECFLVLHIVVLCCVVRLRRPFLLFSNGNNSYRHDSQTSFSPFSIYFEMFHLYCHCTELLVWVWSFYL